MTDTGARWICKNLKENLTLVHLDLSWLVQHDIHHSSYYHSNKLSRDGASHLAEFLATNPPLKILNINCNRIESEGLIAISTVLMTVNNRLKW